jgi:hypothetical protein
MLSDCLSTISNPKSGGNLLLSHARQNCLPLVLIDSWKSKLDDIDPLPDVDENQQQATLLS